MSDRPCQVRDPQRQTKTILTRSYLTGDIYFDTNINMISCYVFVCMGGGGGVERGYLDILYLIF